MKEDCSGTILLVEDNEDDVFAMERALNKAGITNPVRLASDGQQALDYLAGTGRYANRNEYPLPFIVFLDLKLPYVHGFDVLSWIRQQPLLQSLVVVVLTSSSEAKDHNRAYALGARSYIVKPPTPETVKEVLNSLNSYWLSHDSSTPLTTA